jgi:hypothetical protein
MLVEDIYSPKINAALLSAELAHKFLLKRNAKVTNLFSFINLLFMPNR